MLHVQRRPYIQPGFHELGHILPSFRVPAARRVGVGQLIHQKQPGAAGQGGVGIEFLQHLTAVGDGFARQYRQVADLRLGARPAMGFHYADQHVAPQLPRRPGGDQHFPGFSHARGRAQKHFQPPLSLPGSGNQQSIGIRPRIAGVHALHCGGLVPGP
jgi:hypothetical protein